MSHPGIPVELYTEASEVGREVLRETVIAAGGLEGVFREFQEDRIAAFDKYGLLMEASSGPAEKDAGRADPEGESQTPLTEQLAALAFQEGMTYEDAVFYYVALGIVRKAGLEEE